MINEIVYSKVIGDLFKNKDFKKRFNKLVWNMHIKPDEFEKNDTRVFGLMKTNSSSESMNPFFNTYSQSENLPLHFMMSYDNAFQKQRNTQKELDHETKNALYKFISPRPIAKHAAKVYTSTLFYEVQKEIYKGSWYCHYKHVGT
uniref:Protein FAR1-RELATED SEQUENCE n=1 Tax=Lactuca sativa TaxID=4236 RepID=A0A9R1US96_LACSA|nr:hypothetical protein LSAT_V11C800405070 [Lactuca sativa]